MPPHPALEGRIISIGNARVGMSARDVPEMMYSRIYGRLLSVATISAMLG
jgi:hypothetical protein